MHLFKHGACLSLLACTALAAFASEPIDMRKLSAQKVELADVSKPGAAAKSFVAATLIDAPVHEVCAQIQNYESYPAFMPNTQSTKVSQSGAGFSVIDVTLKLPLGKIKKYRLRMEPKSGEQTCTVAWKLVPWPGLKQEETITDTTGAWQLTQGATAGQTIVRYNVTTDPGPIPFGAGWIVDSMSKDSIPQTLDALRKRVQAK
jgi:hypothetical protein